ncbi:tyrosine-type recombinase/integrase [Candidatus Binatus sp.]|uniref:tyrosine-type recombinase/integrase n=1 Tax=Candidatus Binatus sp. TaxID=2811406 RepID=UPI003C5B9937
MKVSHLLAVIHGGDLPAFPVRESEVVRFAPNKQPIRARLTLAQDLHFFLTTCALSYSERTVEHYGRDLRDFERIVSTQYGQPIPSTAINVPAVQFYLHELRKRGVTDTTYERHFQSLSAFFQFRFAMRDLPNVMEHIDRPKTRPRPLPVILSIADACRLCDLDSHDRTPAGLRDGAIVETLYACGLRVNELVNLKWNELDAPGGLVFVRKGKGGKDRIVPIGRKAIRKLHRWRAWLAPAIDDPIFPRFLNRPDSKVRRAARKRMTTRAVEYIVAERAERAGIALPITPHTLRHCFVTHLLENGADSLSVRAMVGHTNLSTTMLYAHLDSAFMTAQATHGRGWSRPAA